VQDQAEDQGLAGLARSRPAATRPIASADHTILAPVPAPLDCPYLHLDDDGPGCVALAPAIRLSRRQVELVCAVAAHVACPRLIRADAGRAPARIEPPAAVRRRDRPPSEATAAAGLAATTISTAGEPAGPGATTAGATTAAATTPTTATPPTIQEPRPIERAVRPAPGPPATSATAAPKPKPDIASGGPGRIAATFTSVRAAVREHISIRPATAVASAIFVAALVIVIALLSARGGLNLPAASSSPAVVLASPSAATPSASPVVASSATVPPSASPSPSPSSSAVASPSPSASPPFPPDRLAVLTPCASGVAGCYQYRIKPNDSLRNLATFFGVAYPALLAANPQIKNPSLIHVGELVTIPLPTP
jgi:LysM repeat protein